MNPRAVNPPHAAEPVVAARAWAIVPAAGRSARMGRPKLLLRGPDGQPLIAATLRAWQASGVAGVVVTVHPDDAALAATCRACGAHVVQPSPPPAEMKDSVLAALAWIRQTQQPAEQDAWLLAPADMPGLSSATIDRLLQAHAEQPAAILVPTCGGCRGHPVLFPWSLAAEVVRLTADEGLNALVRRHGGTLLETHEPGILLDIDTPDDYERWRRGSAGAP